MSLTLKIAKNGSDRLAYRVGGDGPAICLIASTGRGGQDFSSLANALMGHGLTVIVPEPRGVGGSDPASPQTDFHGLAADVVAVIRAETDQAFVAGHAFGCWIARVIAAGYPSLATGLILMAAGARQWPVQLSGAIDRLASDSASREERLAALRLAFFAPQSNPEPWLSGWHPDLIELQRTARTATEQSSWWHSGTAPILDLIAQQDPFRPPTSYQEYADEFGERVTVEQIDQASHALPHEQPEQVAQLIAQWIKSIGLRLG